MIAGLIVLVVIVIFVLIWYNLEPKFDVIEDDNDGGEWLIVWYNTKYARSYKVLWRWN